MNHERKIPNHQNPYLSVLGKKPTSANPITISCFPLLLRFWLKFPIAHNMYSKIPAGF